MRTFKTATGIFAAPQLPPDFVFAVLKALADSKKQIQQAHPTPKNFTVKTGVEGMLVPFHAGAVMYLKEKGLK